MVSSKRALRMDHDAVGTGWKSPLSQFLCAVQYPVHRAFPARPLQVPRPTAPESLPEPDAYFSPTVTEARTAPDFATYPLNFKRLGCVMIPFEILTTKSRSEEHTSELQSRSDIVCRLLLEKK